MKQIIQNKFNYLLILCPLLFFYLGYKSRVFFDWNFDIYFSHSFLIFLITILLVTIDQIFKSYKFNNYVRFITLIVFTTSFLPLFLSIIQNDLVNTRWLELGLFATGDAVDYVNQSINYIHENEIYSKKGRIIFPIIYAGLLAELDFNTSLIQLIITFFLSISTFCTAILIYKYYGYNYAIIFSGLSIDYLVEHLGGACTELIGYIFGACAFVFFMTFKKEKKINYFYFFFFFILIAYLIRPSFPFLLPAIFIWSFLFIKKSNLIKRANIFFIATFAIFTFIFMSNNIILQTKSPQSPKVFGNIYDSWYATHELGKYYNEGKYDKLPSLLWTRIIEDNPDINSLKGDQEVKRKKDIIFESLINNPENYLIGSLLQIVKFFEVSKKYEERYHNSSGFLHIEFYFYRIFVLCIFFIAGVFSVYNYIFNKNFRGLLSGLILFSILISQPFVFGGDARTSAPVIFFLNYVIIKFIFDVNCYFFKINKSHIYESYNNNIYSLLLLCPIIGISYFFLNGMTNKYDFFNEHNKRQIICPMNFIETKIIFNNESGFYLNSSKSDLLEKQKSFTDFYNQMANIAILEMQYGKEVSFDRLSKKEILKLDKFKYITPFLSFIDTRLLSNTNRGNLIFQTLANQYLNGGGYFINPINKQSGKLEGLIILNKNNIKKGLNDLSVCLKK